MPAPTVRIKSRSRTVSLVASAIFAIPSAVFAQSYFNAIGVTPASSERAKHYRRRGPGRAGGGEFQLVLEAMRLKSIRRRPGQPQSLFTYIDQYGNSSECPQCECRVNARRVGRSLFFTGRMERELPPGVSHVDNYSVDYFFNTAIFFGEPIPDAVVNQSFSFGQSNIPSLNLADQESSDTSYDNLLYRHSTARFS